MSETIYHKLVRDRIPAMIKEAGGVAHTRILSHDEYIPMLDRKLDEELAEYHADGSLEELADLYEVIRAVTVARGYTLEDLEAVRVRKHNARGGFDARILLIKTED